MNIQKSFATHGVVDLRVFQISFSYAAYHNYHHAICVFVVPAFSSVLGCHSVSLRVHLLSVFFAIYCALPISIGLLFSLSCLTLVLFLISKFLTVTQRDIQHSYFHCMLCCSQFLLKIFLCPSFAAAMSLWVVHIG